MGALWASIDDETLHHYLYDIERQRRTSEERQAIYMRAYAWNLEDEGLRSPEYYRGKSQCVFFGDCSPAMMGVIKAMKLKRGYVEPEDLIGRLRRLKPCDNFELREYNHRIMQWNKSPMMVEETLVIGVPAPDWYW